MLFRLDDYSSTSFMGAAARSKWPAVVLSALGEGWSVLAIAAARDLAPDATVRRVALRDAGGDGGGRLRGESGHRARATVHRVHRAPRALLDSPTDYSLPSGHAAGSFAFALFVTHVLLARRPRPGYARPELDRARPPRRVHRRLARRARLSLPARRHRGGDARMRPSAAWRGVGSRGALSLVGSRARRARRARRVGFRLPSRPAAIHTPGECCLAGVASLSRSLRRSPSGRSRRRRMRRPPCAIRAAPRESPRPPQLQQPQTTIDVGTAPEDCSELLAMTTAFDNGRAPEPSPPSAAQDPVVPNGAPAIPPAAVSGCFVGEDSTVCVRAGARSRVDRPPRA